MGIKKMKIKEFAEVVSGSTPKTKVDEYWNGEYFWITPAEIKEGDKYINYTSRTITKEGINSCSLRELRPNTVLLSSRAPIGKVALLGNSMYCNQGFKNLICNEEIVNPEYIYYWLSSKKEYLNSLGRGATFKEISKKIVEDIEVPVQTLEEQKKIVNVLNKAQELIDKRKEQIEFLDELVKSRFIAMFGNPLNNSKGWEKTTLDYYSNLVTYGLTVRPDYIDTGIPLISAKEIRSGIVGYNEAPKISIEDFSRLSEKGKPKKNDILFSKTGSIGHCALVDTEEIFAITQNAARISLNLDIINPLWCLYYLRTDYIQSWCQKKSKGNAVKDFQLQDMKKIPIFICDKKLQNQFADFVKQVDKLKFEMEKSLKELKNNFSSLMQKAFNGEL